MAELSAAKLAGSLIVGGFEGTTVPPSFVRAMQRRERAGAILFKRNLPSVEVTRELCRTLRATLPSQSSPPILAVDQEGGRVVRLPAPCPALPAMQLVAELPTSLVRRAGYAVGHDLAMLGFNLNFAPVLDVDSNPENPIIGNRSFGSDPHVVSEKAIAFAEGLGDAGVVACGKHFPGHGDTDVDSHLGLPHVKHDRSRLDAVELAPFQAACRSGIPSLMTAHLVASALDAENIATFSPAIMQQLLRDTFGFQGVLFSDDLEMMAVAQTMTIEESSIRAILAGCDALLICRSEELQDRAHIALTKETETSASFAARARQAQQRMETLRQPRDGVRRGTASDTQAIWAQMHSALSQLGAIAT